MKEIIEYLVNIYAGREYRKSNVDDMDIAPCDLRIPINGLSLRKPHYKNDNSHFSRFPLGWDGI